MNSTILKSINESFRVENRKAKPKIIKNINNIQNIFIMPTRKYSNVTCSSQDKKKKIRRNIAKQTASFINMTDIRQKESEEEEKPSIKDDYYFTFYNDKNVVNPPPSTNPDIKTPEV